MARILFETPMEATPASITTALTTRDGIAGWWTDDVDLDGGAGSTMRLGFPIAPVPFELRLEETADDRVVWRSVGEFPPHWIDTTVTWTLRPGDDGATVVHFAHEGWDGDEGPFAMSAYTWGQLVARLAAYAADGRADPLFVAAA